MIDEELKIYCTTWKILRHLLAVLHNIPSGGLKQRSVQQVVSLIGLIMGDKKAEKQFIVEFIEVYRGLPALWDVKSKDYSNRAKKGEQYDVLIQKYREKHPDAEKQEVVKKINTVCTMWLYVCARNCAIYCTTFNIASIWYNFLHKPQYCTIILNV